LEIGNKRLTLNLYSYVVMHFQECFKFHKLSSEEQKLMQTLLVGL